MVVPALCRIKHELNPDMVLVYGSEAHAVDEWNISSGRGNCGRGPVLVAQHKTLADRCKAASKMHTDFELGWMPMLIDSMDNQFDEHYAAWPLRWYLLLRSGESVELKYALGEALYTQPLEECIQRCGATK